MQPSLLFDFLLFFYNFNLITAVDHQVFRDSNRRLCGVQLQIEMEIKKQEKRFPNSNPKNIELGLGGGEDERAE